MVGGHHSEGKKRHRAGEIKLRFQSPAPCLSFPSEWWPFFIHLAKGRKELSEEATHSKPFFTLVLSLPFAMDKEWHGNNLKVEFDFKVVDSRGSRLGLILIKPCHGLINHLEGELD